MAEGIEGGEAAEEAHFEDAGLSRIDFGESVEGVVDLDHAGFCGLGYVEGVVA